MALYISLIDEKRTLIRHATAGAEIRTDVSPEYGGSGQAFSSTDLVAAGLGSCIATNLSKMLPRHGLPLESMQISVGKRLTTAPPKRIAALTVIIDLDRPVEEGVRARLLRAAHLCAVHRSLHPEVEVSIELVCEAHPA